MKNKKKKHVPRGTELSLAAADGSGHQKHGKISGNMINPVSGYLSKVKGAALYWPTEGWRTTTPEAQGMDSALIADVMDAFRNRHVHSMVIVRNGYLVAEAYKGDVRSDSPQDVRSVTKSITSALTGIALSEHKLNSIETTITEYFPDLAKIPLKSEIKIKHLLSMTSGLEWNDEHDQSSKQMMYSDDWIQAILNHPARSKPGTIFNYSNGDSHLLSAVLHKATGESLFDYALSRLFTPLGITNVKWSHDPQGYSIGAWGMGLTVRDMAKIGLLFAKEGEWDGQTILPKSWIKESLTKRVNHNYRDGAKGGYGFYWWLKTLNRGLFEDDPKKYDTFYAAGSGGPRIYVVPELKLIVALTAKSADIDMPEQLLLGIIKSIRSAHPLSESADAYSRLNQAIQSFKMAFEHA